MKKVLTVGLAIAIIIAILSGCGSKNGKGENKEDTTSGKTVEATTSPAKTDNGSGNKNEPSKSDESAPGSELSTFMSNYMDTKSKVWDAMAEEFEKSGDMAFAMGALAFTFADLTVVEVGLFDSLTVKDGDTYKGLLALSGIDAWKKIKGDIIEFGYDYVYQNDKNQSKKGDRDVSSGKFDKKNNSLIYEKYTERNGVKVNRYVVEVTKNSDKSYSSQIYILDSSGSNGKDSNTLNGYITWFEGENIISYLVEKEKSDLNYSYGSIFGKKNMRPEDMAKDMSVAIKTSFIDGKVQYEEVKK